MFFRDQHLSHAQHIAFARQFGELTVGHPVFGHVDGHPELYSVSKHRKANRFEGRALLRPWSGWHTDVTAAVNPPAASILRGVVIPPYGGDTQWTNLAAAYRALSAPLRAIVDGLRGVHRFTAPVGASATAAFDRAVKAHTLVSEHPLVRVHPETGERVLYISPSFLQHLSGFHPRESQQLLELLWEHAVRPEFTVRFQWEPGSLAFWDNRATAHRRPPTSSTSTSTASSIAPRWSATCRSAWTAGPRWRWKATGAGGTRCRRVVGLRGTLPAGAALRGDAGR